MSKTLKLYCLFFIFLTLSILVIWGLGETFTPLIIAFGLSYLLFPIVIRLEKLGFKREYAVPSVFVLLCLVLGLLIAFFLPGLISDLKSFITELPVNGVLILDKLENLAKSLGYSLGFSRKDTADFIHEHALEISNSMFKSLSGSIKSSFGSIAKWLVTLLNIFLIPLFLFYFINDHEKISKEIGSYIPKGAKQKLKEYKNHSHMVLSGYIRGQLIVALVLAFLYATGLWIVGLRFGILIGIITGFISIIPYLGFTLGFIAAMCMGLATYTGLAPLVGIALVYGVVQFFESFIITPKLVGDRVGLGPMPTILALVVGGNIFGLVGMLIAIPIAAIAKVMVRDLKIEYQKLNFYKND